MFLEANINELFADSHDFKNSGHTRQLSDECNEKIADKWINEISGNSRITVIEKYNLFLELCDKDRFEPNWHILSNIELLRQVRNRLVHYAPETVDFTDPLNNIGSARYENLESRLRNKNFNLNPLLPNNIFFPDQSMSHGFTKWVITNCIIFADEFFNRLGIDKPYEHVRNDLVTE